MGSNCRYINENLQMGANISICSGEKPMTNIIHLTNCDLNVSLILKISKVVFVEALLYTSVHRNVHSKIWTSPGVGILNRHLEYFRFTILNLSNKSPDKILHGKPFGCTPLEIRFLFKNAAHSKL